MSDSHDKLWLANITPKIIKNIWKDKMLQMSFPATGVILSKT